jgi:hypothetical protein
MPKRAAKFVSIAFVNLLAGIPLVTASQGETVGDDQCLSSPKGETPAGHHWYYHSDHAGKRNCWYLRPQGSSLSQATPQSILPPATTPAPRVQPPVQPSVADARAEVRARNNQDNATAFPATPATPKEAPPATSWTDNTAPAVVATRWPELSATRSAPPSQPATAGAADNLSRESSRQTRAAATLAPLAAAASAVPGEPSTIRNLIAATLGALALAGAAAMLISSRRRAGGRLRRGDVRYGQGPIWETTDDTRIVISTHPGSAARDYRPRFARSARDDRTVADRAVRPRSRMSRGRPA